MVAYNGGFYLQIQALLLKLFLVKMKFFDICCLNSIDFELLR